MTAIARLCTAIVGFGRMSHGYASDPAMARYFPYASHAQVLRDHPLFEWCAVVDSNAGARDAALEQWSVPAAASTVAGLGIAAERVELAVVATPPNARLKLLDDFPNLRAVLVEKPLGETLTDAHAFLAACESRGIVVQVNFWRRADERFRALADGDLAKLIGRAQAGVGFYGNGLLNNGSHMIDFVRLLLGEVESVQRIATAEPWLEGPIPSDANPSFALGLESGISVVFQALSFRHYRENGLVIWGEQGRVDMLNEGLTLRHYPSASNRAMSGEREVASDEPGVLPATAGMALFHMYTNLAETLAGRASLWSSGSSALATTRVVEAVSSAPLSGERVFVA